MTWLRVLIVVLALVEASWMSFDGTRALVVGDYVTPRSGAHAGQLGPWHYVVSAVGIPPRSTAMKTLFLVYGVCWFFIVIAFVRGTSWAATGMLIAAVGSLWYLPIGTVFSILQIAGLVWLRTSGTGR